MLSSSFSAVRFTKEVSRNTGIIRVFRREASGISLQPRLRGGARSLALTLLRPNALLTGKITGNFKILLSEIALLFSKPHILQEKEA